MNFDDNSASPLDAQTGRRRSAVVLVFDRLQPAFLGPYGGTACETPACNRLAAEGFVAEQCYADAAELESVYLSYWSGIHAVQRANVGGNATESTPNGRSLAERLEAAHIPTELLTDDPRVASHRWSEGFGNRLAIDHGAAPTEAETAGSMRVAQVLAAAAERWEQSERPGLLWMHAAAWDDAWDAPYEFRQQWADPEDPAPPTFATPPQKLSTTTLDHDELLGYVQGYVGQVAAWDACLEAFLESFLASPLAADALLIVTSPRGFPLGEHHRVGAVPPALFNELLQLPLLIRYPQGAHPLVRDQGFIQPADLYATLLDWFAVSPTPPRASSTEDSLPTSSAAILEKEDAEPNAEDAERFASTTVWGQSLLPRVEGLPDQTRRLAAATTHGQLVVRTPRWLLRMVNAAADMPQDAAFDQPREAVSNEAPDASFKMSSETAPASPTLDGDVRVELYVKPDDRWEANEVSSRCEADLHNLRILADAIRGRSTRP